MIECFCSYLFYQALQTNLTRQLKGRRKKKKEDGQCVGQDDRVRKEPRGDFRADGQISFERLLLQQQIFNSRSPGSQQVNNWGPGTQDKYTLLYDLHY